MQICTHTADLHGIFTHFRPKTMQIRTHTADLHGFRYYHPSEHKKNPTQAVKRAWDFA